MKNRRVFFLVGVLAVLGLVWGGVQYSDWHFHSWLETASRKELESYLRDQPNQPDATVRLSELLIEDGEIEAAAARMKPVVESNPTDEAAIIAYAKTLAPNQAISLLKQFLNTTPENILVTNEVAQQYLRAGDAQKAIQVAEQATQTMPNSADAWRGLGEIQSALRRPVDAERSLRHSLMLQDSAETRLDLTRLLIPLERYPEIIALCTPITDSFSASAQQKARAKLYLLGAKLYQPMREAQLSVLQSQLEELAQAATRLPKGERFLSAYFLGEGYLRASRPKRAIETLESAVQQNPMFPGSLYSLARAYHMAGRTADFNQTLARHQRLIRLLTNLDQLNNRLEQRADDAESLLKLADTLVEAGNKEEAKAEYERLISLNKYKEVAQKRLQKLTSKN